MFKVDREICIACEQCIKDCPVNDIYLKEGKAHIKNEEQPEQEIYDENVFSLENQDQESEEENYDNLQF